MTKKFSPSEKRLLLGSVALIALMGGVGVVLSRGGQPSVKIAPHAPTPVPNGIDFYVAAARAVAPANPPVDAVNDTRFSTLSPQQKSARYSLARRQAWESASAKAWALFEQGKAAESLQPEARSLTRFGSNFSTLRQLMRDKMAVANTCILRGDWDGALRNDLDDVEMGHDIARGGGDIAALVEFAVSAMGTRNAQQAAARFDGQGAVVPDDVVLHLTAAQAKAGAKRLEQLIATAPKLSETLREEKAIEQTQWLETWDDPGPKQNRFAAMLRPQARMFALYSQTVDGFVAAADKPYGTHQKWPHLEQPILAAPEFSPQRVTFAFTRAKAAEQILMLRLALRVYKLEHGTYPAKLSDLVPNYLRQVPIDPFGKGEAWRYKAGLAWSVGPDGKDNGGQSVVPRPGRKMLKISEVQSDNKGDLGAVP